MKQLFNLHTHTSRCGHASGSDEEYVLAAIKAGYKVLGFSDHCPYMEYPNKRVHMDWDELEDYISSINALKEKYKDQIEIHVGLESEYFPQFHEEKEYLRSKVEYMIFGQHFLLPECKHSYFGNVSDAEINAYVDQVLKGLDSGLFTYLCHPDVFMNSQTAFTEACYNAAHKIAQKAVETDTPVEINIRGAQKGKKEFRDGSFQFWYPNKQFWKIMAEYPIKCVVGVDAHAPEDLLDKEALEAAYEELSDLNLNYVKVIV